jgi:hypothetical protein
LKPGLPRCPVSDLAVKLDRRAAPVGSGSLVGQFILAVKTPALWNSQEYLHKVQDELREVELNWELKKIRHLRYILKAKDVRRSCRLSTQRCNFQADDKVVLDRKWTL